jgi:hypothetical protein
MHFLLSLHCDTLIASTATISETCSLQSIHLDVASEAVKAAAERSAAGEDDEDHDNRKLKKVKSPPF